jgi:hypothetical protein
MKINNGNYNAKIFSRYAAFILQDDILLESLTVRGNTQKIIKISK